MWWLCFPVLLLGYVLWTLPYYRGAYFRGTHTPYLQMRLQKGRYTEYLAVTAAHRALPDGLWVCNLYLPKNDRATTEIDAVLLHESGVYVLECKDLRGSVSGTADARTWTLTTPEGVIYPFYNPILQNQTHMEQIAWRLPRMLYRSMIVFGNRTTLADVPRTIGDHTVCTLEELPGVLAELAARTPNQHSRANIKMGQVALFPFTHPTKAMRRLHNDTIKKQQLLHTALPQDDFSPHDVEK